MRRLVIIAISVCLLLLASVSAPAAASPGRLWVGSMSAGVWESSAEKPGNGPPVGPTVNFYGYETKSFAKSDGTFGVSASGGLSTKSLGESGKGEFEVKISIELLDYGADAERMIEDEPIPVRITISHVTEKDRSVLEFTAINYKAKSPKAFKDKPVGPSNEPNRLWHLTEATGIFEPLAKTNGNPGVGNIPPGNEPKLPHQMWVGSC